MRLHGLLPVQPQGALPTHEPPLVMRMGVHTVWTDGSGRHSSYPHFRRCGVGHVTDTGERAWLPLPGCWQSNRSLELNYWPWPFSVANDSPKGGTETSK
eukprot:286164-Amphidinium_carterae.2